MLVDFQQHYTPPELLKGNADAVSVQVDQDGNPNYLLNPLLADLTAHIRVMDAGRHRRRRAHLRLRLRSA